MKIIVHNILLKYGGELEQFEFFGKKSQFYWTWREASDKWTVTDAKINLKRLEKAKKLHDKSTRMNFYLSQFIDPLFVIDMIYFWNFL